MGAARVEEAEKDSWKVMKSDGGEQETGWVEERVIK